MAASLPATMRALRMLRSDGAAPPVMELASVPTPKAGPGQLLVKVAASPIHPSDTMNAKGGFGLTLFPRTPGRDFAGTVVAGSAHRIGEEVFGTGGSTYAFVEDGFQAEYAVVAEDEVVPKPRGLSFTQTAVLGVPSATADQMLEAAGAKRGETALVLGAHGAVGKSAVLIANHRGCRVFQAVRGAGGEVDTAGDPQMNSLDALTGGKGVDIVLDTVGSMPLTVAAIAKLADHGRFVTITAPRSGPKDRILEIDLLDLYRSNKHLIGCNSLSASPKDAAAQLRRILPLFESDTYKSSADQSWEEVSLQGALDVYRNGPAPKKKYIVVMDKA